MSSIHDHVPGMEVFQQAQSTTPLKEKERVAHQPNVSVVHSTQGKPSLPVTELPTEARTQNEARASLGHLEADYDRLFHQTSVLEGRLTQVEHQNPNSPETAGLRKEISANQQKLQETSTKIQAKRSELFPNQPTLSRNTTSPDLMPSPTQMESIEPHKPPPKMEPKPLQSPSVEQQKPPEATPERNNQVVAQHRADRFVNNAVNLWSGVRTTEKRLPTLQKELTAVKEEIAQAKTEVAQRKAAAFDPKKAAGPHAERNRDALIEAETRLSNLEQKGKGLEQQVKFAQTSAKVIYKNGELVLAPRTATTGIFQKPGSSEEAKMGIKKILAELVQAEKMGISQFNLSDGTTVTATALMTSISNTQYGKEIFDNNPALKKAAVEIAYRQNFAGAVTEGKELSSLYSQNQGNIQRLTQKIAARQEQSIAGLPQTVKYKQSIANLPDRGQRIKAMENFSQAEVNDFFAKLHLDINGVNDEVLKNKMLDLLENPKEVMFNEAGTFYPLEGEMKKMVGDTGIKKSLQTIENNMKTREAREELISRDGGNLSAGALMQVSTMGKYKERTESLLKTLVRLNAAYEKIPPQNYQGDLRAAFGNDAKDWQKGFSLLARF